MIQILQMQRNGKSIYIVLDRADKCKEESVRKIALLIALAKIVAQAKYAIVKILVVVNTLYWESFERDWEALKRSGFYDPGRVQQCQRDQQMVCEIEGASLFRYVADGFIEIAPR
jgi:hypothetical protein